MLVHRPAALIDGPTAALLQQLLAAPAVRAVTAALPVWARRHRTEIAAGLDAIDRAAAHWTATAPALERDDAEPVSAAAPLSDQITVAEAADLLKLSRRRVQELVTAGELAGRRVGRAWLLDRTVVESVAAERRRGR